MNSMHDASCATAESSSSCLASKMAAQPSAMTAPSTSRCRPFELLMCRTGSTLTLLCCCCKCWYIAAVAAASKAATEDSTKPSSVNTYTAHDTAHDKDTSE
eukprot:GHRQ01037436.1.p2 GENE.GHRQ01037436.1~~GHRQ01037436.1.p2  ORF type:complete len:101 (+),score=15.53 GHRQ01037436.1:412-714(+)